jgi:uncharacterized protein YbjT (DUF2867 family)
VNPTKQPRSKIMNKHLKIVVIGGSGLIGARLVKNLRQHSQEVVAASPSSGVNTITGEGLARALADAQVVVDVSNAPSWEDEAVLEFFETSGRNLSAAEAAAGVGHHVALSVVGTERLLASGYFRAKMAQEDLIKASGIPYTIVRQRSSSNSRAASPNSAPSDKRFTCRQPCFSQLLPMTSLPPSPRSHSTRRQMA